MKILLVEDDADKRREVSRVICSCEGVTEDQIEHAPDVASARRALRERVFDLLVLDIALPLTSDRDPDLYAGLSLLDEVLAHPRHFNVPQHVIGITGHADVRDRASEQFSSRLLTLVWYERGSADWELSVKARVSHIQAALMTPSGSTTEYLTDACIVCALDQPELSAIRSLGWDWHPLRVAGDHTQYWKGQVKVDGVTRSVVAAAAARKGLTPAAVLSMKMIAAFRPRVLAMAGITAGVRGRTNIGDVLIADPVWDWGSGKSVRAGEFLPAPYQLSLAAHVRERCREISADHSLAADIRAGWLAPKPEQVLAIRLGPVASGATVLADDEVVRHVMIQHKDLMGIEMEGFAVFAAAEQASEPRPTPVVVKSVVDFGDGEKNDTYQSYGAYTSACVLARVIQQLLA